MADNLEITAGTGTTVAADDIAGVLYQRVKSGLGADGSFTDPVGGAGSVSAAVQRVTLASDDPAVVDLAALEVLVTAGNALLTTSAALSKAEDAAHSSADTGIMALAVRKDTSTTGIGADGDYTPLAVNASGHLYTREAAVAKPLAGHYETVAASQTDQMMGATGATGDYLAGVLIIPATTSPGAVSIEDGSTNIPIFTGGASSVSNLVPFFVPLGIYSVSGGWEITTGTNVSVIGVGSFTA